MSVTVGVGPAKKQYR